MFDIPAVERPVAAQRRAWPSGVVIAASSTDARTGRMQRLQAASPPGAGEREQDRFAPGRRPFEANDLVNTHLHRIVGGAHGKHRSSPCSAIQSSVYPTARSRAVASDIVSICPGGSANFDPLPSVPVLAVTAASL